MCPATKTIALSAEAATCLPGVRFDVPVEDAADERRNECAAKLGGGDGLGHGKHECEVARDTLLLQNLRPNITSSSKN